MAGCSIYLDLNKAQLETISKVLGGQCPVVQPVPAHQTGPVLKYGIYPPGKPPHNVHTLYAVDIPEKPGHFTIHFTEEQKDQLKCAGASVCDYIEVESIGLRYGIVMPHVMRYAMPVPPEPAPKK